jgi:hypothetical protein
MTHFKLNDVDEHFLQVPQDAMLIFDGASGTETWIERDSDATVRLAIHSVAVATADAATLQVCIEVAGASAKGEDGPAPADFQLRAGQSVQMVVKAGERLNFKAYPTATNAQVLRTVVWAADLK